MLTEKDRKWLEERAVESCEACRSCREVFCDACARDPGPKVLAVDFFSLSGCDLYPDWEDAAEFEARVAAKLARTFDGPAPCERGEIKHFPYESNGIGSRITCRWCRLKHARLAVEAEMKKEGK